MAELDDKVIVTKDKITTIADTIREEGGTSDLMTLDEMPDNIRAIGGGGSADVKRLGITLANNTARFNLNGREIWQLIGSNKTIVADITYIDGNNDRSYNKSCTASLKSEAGDTQTRIEASVVIYKNYKFYVRYFNMVIGASSMEDTGTYAVTDIEIPEVTDANPFFVCTNNTVTCSKTFAEIEFIYASQNVANAVAPQLVYRTSSSGAYGTRSIYGVVTQIDADRFSFKFNMGYSTGAQWQERIIVIDYARGDILRKLDDYNFEYQKPIVEGDGINITTQGAGKNQKSQISVDSSMIMIGNASGSVASIVDGADDIPLKSCIVDIEPVQDLHGYDHPWAGGSGKNKVPYPYNVPSGTYGGVSVTYDNDGTIKLNSSLSGNAQDLKMATVPLQAGTYKFSSIQSSTRTRAQLYRNNSILISLDNDDDPYTFTVNAGDVIDFYLQILSNTYNNDTVRVQVESGSTATTWEPYSNICPISGWTELNLSDVGANLWDEQWEVGDINSLGVPIPVNDRIRCKNFIQVKPNTTYYLKCPTINARIITYDKDKNFVEYSDGINNRTFTTGSNVYYIKFYMFTAYGTTYNNDISINYPSTDTSYHAYKGNTYNIQFPSSAGTVYDGTLDVTNGVLTVTDGYIASYNGETLPSTWISSMDVYAEGTTPTTGAEVVYKLATPQTYNVTPTEIKTLLEINNIFADCGDVDVEYVRDATLIINKLLELVSGNNNRTMMKSAVVEKTDEVQEQKKDSVEEDLDA